jgi:hypothetical protein|tara:strand:- start:384 stop:671 length:288 start_codon:yes stop_codon:yes gene_type:complete
MQEKQLREIIRQELSQLSESKSFINEDGSILEYGSQKHVDIFNSAINELAIIRKNLPYRQERKERFTITKCMESLKHLRAKAQKSGIKSGLIKED